MKLSDRAALGYVLLLLCVLTVVGTALFFAFRSVGISEPVSGAAEETESLPEAQETQMQDGLQGSQGGTVPPEFPRELEVDSEVPVPEEEKEHYVQDMMNYIQQHQM